MCRLIWGFVGRTYHIVGNLMSMLKYLALFPLIIMGNKACHFMVHQTITSKFQALIPVIIGSYKWPFKSATVKPALTYHSKKWPKINCQCWFLLNAGQKYCRMLQESILQFQESILQYFRPSLSYYLSIRPLFCKFLSGSLRQVLLCM